MRRRARVLALGPWELNLPLKGNEQTWVQITGLLLTSCVNFAKFLTSFRLLSVETLFQHYW